LGGFPALWKRGTFSATFFLACLAAMELEGVVLEEIQSLKSRGLMGRFKVSELVVGFVLGFAFLLLIFLLSLDIAAHYEVCDTTKEGAKECARYGVVHFALHEIAAALDSYNGLITAIATICIAWFTFSLRQSTDRLWDAGERQIALARESSGSQGRDMQASIAEAVRAASAMENVAQGITVSAQAAQNSVATLRERTAMQMRAYVAVVIGGGVYQERDKSLRFEAKPIMLNTGHTPAHDVGFQAVAAIMAVPLDDDFDFPLPDEIRGAAPLGPNQTFIMSAIVPDYIDDAEIDNIKKGIGKALVVWGIVKYRDVFGEERQTRFGHAVTWLPNGNIYGYYNQHHNDST
jgi:hypothetical protein